MDKEYRKKRVMELIDKSINDLLEYSNINRIKIKVIVVDLSKGLSVEIRTEVKNKIKMLTEIKRLFPKELDKLNCPVRINFKDSDVGIVKDFLRGVI